MSFAAYISAENFGNVRAKIVGIPSKMESLVKSTDFYSLFFCYLFPPHRFIDLALVCMINARCFSHKVIGISESKIEKKGQGGKNCFPELADFGMVTEGFNQPGVQYLGHFLAHQTQWVMPTGYDTNFN